ncbi:---NA--- [Paramuricea clavata]|uniref:---NA n=1 Tax=Paramuricea clavata TaxID=317549 RepID=A0A6S7HH50_PARCT|nr:---NA--- [Paramuricea clavata]
MASYQCDRCLKQFSSYYNVRRHKASHCAYAKIDDNTSMDGGGSSYSDEQSVDSFPDEESVTETEEDENSENSEDDGEIKEEIDPWATMIDDAKATVRPEYDEFMKTLQMDGQEEMSLDGPERTHPNLLLTATGPPSPLTISPITMS